MIPSTCNDLKDSNISNQAMCMSNKDIGHGFEYKNFQKENELSTKSSTKDNFLDYTFISHRSQISFQGNKNIGKSKEYIFDLTNTWYLNVSMIENFIKDKAKSNNEESQSVLSALQRIKASFYNKTKLRKAITEKKSKLLIENQIIEEFKRKIEENSGYYQEQIKELEENLENKEEYIKIFEKKLKEVEIYIQKNTKSNNDPKYEAFKDFKMNEFITKNTNLVRVKETKGKEVLQYKKEIYELMEENKKYVEEVEYANTETNSDHINPRILIEKEKLKQCLQQFRNQIKKVEIKRNFLKSLNLSLQDRLNGYEVQRKVERKSSNHNLPHNDNENDRSAINLDITRKLQTYMDFSIILNKKNADDTADFGTAIANVTNNAWEISCINKINT